MHECSRIEDIGHRPRLEAGDDGAEEENCEYGAIEEVRGIVFVPDKADGAVGPDQEEGGEDREAGCGFVYDVLRPVRDEREREPRSCQKYPREDEIEHGPAHLARELHSDKGNEQYAGSAEHDADHVVGFHRRTYDNQEVGERFQ